jgi:hypothetical protein
MLLLGELCELAVLFTCKFYLIWNQNWIAVEILWGLWGSGSLWPPTLPQDIVIPLGRGPLGVLLCHTEP